MKTEIVALINALEDEYQGIEFYKELAKMFDNPEIRNALNQIAKEEQGHYEYIKKLLFYYKPC